MEGSAGAPPAAADSGEAQAAPAQEQAQQPVQPATVPQQEQQAPESDVQSQLAQMRQDYEQLASEVRGDQPQDLVGALSPQEGPDDLGFTPEQLAALQAGDEMGEADPSEADAQLNELDSYMDERIQEALQPMVQERRIQEVQAFGKEHPDIMQPEILERVEPTIENFIERYGEDARYDTRLLELAYRGAKAELADANAVPAEQAAGHGASIETQAGQTQQGESSEQDDYVKAILGAGSGGDAFTG